MVTQHWLARAPEPDIKLWGFLGLDPWPLLPSFPSFLPAPCTPW